MILPIAANIRPAKRGDGPLLLDFIRKLAVYEKLEDQVTATPELLEKNIIDNKHAEVFFVMNEENVEVGYALFFYTFSTFLGKPGIFLEDLFVLPEYRKKGYGTLLLNEIAQQTVKRGMGRLEWHCLKWNTPSLDFYKAWGAETHDEWLMLRLTEELLEKLDS